MNTNIFEENPVIAAVKTNDDFKKALNSSVNSIFLLSCSIFNVGECIKLCQKHGKLVFVHLDMVEGLAKDAVGVKYIASFKPYGVISTRSGTVKLAKSEGLVTVQRLFMVDGQSVDTAFESIRTVHPDYVELMPGVIPKIIKQFCDKGIKTIAGGLIYEQSEAYQALKSGAIAISTSKNEFWQ